MSNANLPEPRCTECNGEGGRSYGHYDQGWADCRYCEGTGKKQKWLRCRACNKFGEVPDHSKELWGYKKCTACRGTTKLPLNLPGERG